MTRYRRWNELLELLAAEGQLQVEEAAKALGVSEATVRRDLDELASQQMLTRIRGGAVAQGVRDCLRPSSHAHRIRNVCTARHSRPRQSEHLCRKTPRLTARLRSLPELG